MPLYGEARFDYLTFTSGEEPVNITTSVSGLVINPTYSGIVTCTSGLNVSGALDVGGDLTVAGNIVNPTFSGNVVFNDIVVQNSGSFNHVNITGTLDVSNKTAFIDKARIDDLKAKEAFAVKTTGVTELAIVRDEDFIYQNDLLGKITVSGNGRDDVFEEIAAIRFVADSIHTYQGKKTSIVLAPNTSQSTFQVLRVTGNGEILFNGFANALDMFPAGGNDGIPGQLGISPLDGDSSSDSTGGGVIIKQNKVASARFFAKFYASDGDDVGAIKNTNTITQFIQTSDYRLKENERPILNGIELVKQLNPLYFNFKKEPNHVMQGFFAHEVQEVVPDAVNGTKDAVDENNRPLYQGIDASYIIPCLTAAVKELIAKVEKLENELAALKAE
mgnify:CR=1 FL=1